MGSPEVLYTILAFRKGGRTSAISTTDQKQWFTSLPAAEEVVEEFLTNPDRPEDCLSVCIYEAKRVVVRLAGPVPKKEGQS